jgi:hypothetical protein
VEKGKVVPVLKHHFMKQYEWSGGKAPHILNLSIDESEWSTYAPAPLLPRERDQEPIAHGEKE